VFVGVEFSCIEDVVVSSVMEVLFELLVSGPDQHVVHEEGVIGSGTDDSDSDSFLLVIPGIPVDNVKLLSGVEIVSGQVFKKLEGTLSHRHVDGSPCDFLISDGVTHDSLGGGGASK
jgi:hypothetical protein